MFLLSTLSRQLPGNIWGPIPISSKLCLDTPLFSGIFCLSYADRNTEYPLAFIWQNVIIRYDNDEKLVKEIKACLKDHASRIYKDLLFSKDA